MSVTQDYKNLTLVDVVAISIALDLHIRKVDEMIVDALAGKFGLTPQDESIAVQQLLADKQRAINALVKVSA